MPAFQLLLIKPMRYGIIRRVVDGSGGGFSRLGNCGEDFFLPTQLRQREQHQQRDNRSAALREPTKYPHIDRTLGEHVCIPPGKTRPEMRPEPVQRQSAAPLGEAAETKIGKLR